MDAQWLLFSIFCTSALMNAIGIFFIFINNDQTEKWIGRSLLCANIAIISYIAVWISKNQTVATIMYSIHFECFTWMLYCLLMYATKLAKLNHKKWLLYGIITLSVIDAINVLINPWTHHVFKVIFEPSRLIPWYVLKLPMFSVHIGFTYVIIIAVFVIIIKKMIHTKKYYHMTYYTLLIPLLIGTIVNAICLFGPNKTGVDITPLITGMVALLIAICYRFTGEKSIILKAQKDMLEDSGKAYIVFNSRTEAIFKNKAAEVNYGYINRLSDVINTMHNRESFRDTERDLFLIDVIFENETSMARCRYNPIIKDNEIIGSYVSISQPDKDKDMLTGLISERAFKDYIGENSPLYNALALVDINKLALINEKYGFEFGNKCLHELASKLRNEFPDNSIVTRFDNSMFCVVSLLTAEEVETKIKDVITNFKAQVKSEDVTVEFIIGKQEFDLINDINKNKQALKTKKILTRASSHSSILDSVLQIMQENDITTAEHVKRTSATGGEFAKFIGLSEKDIVNLKLLCLMHDVGKLAIPSEILNKTQKLNDEEWIIMRQHCEKGYRITKAAPEFAEISECVLHHHENWDGSGYPTKLSKDAIPRLSRIIMIIDAYDAMTNDRPYRKGMSQEQALDELRKNSGTQFDPNYVEKFIEMMTLKGEHNEK